MKNTPDKKTTVTRQTLYMAILVSVTLGFFLGAAYTSFRLADEPAAPAGQASGPKQDGARGMDQREADAYADRILKTQAFLKENPDNAEAWARLGNLFFDTDRFADAIGAYEKSLTLKPGDPNILTDLGVMHRRNGNPEKAIQAFERAIAADERFETARFNKGIVLMADLKDLPGALKAWEELVAVNPMAATPGGELVKTMVERMKKKTDD